MYSVRDLDQEVTTTVARQRDHNDKLSKSWLIAALVNDHKDIQGGDAGFALMAIAQLVPQRVELYFRKIRKIEDAPEAPEQLVLTGYRRVQREYIVERDDDALAISVWDMTDEEIETKAAEHKAMGQGHFEHARELLKFLEVRRQGLPGTSFASS